MIKLIASDLDGTLMQADHMTVSEENIKALRAASKQGITIVLASGRTVGQMLYVADQVGCVDYIIGANGAVVVDHKTGKRLPRTAELSPETAAQVFDILKDYDIACEVYHDGRFYMEEHMKAIVTEKIPQTSDFIAYLNSVAVTVDSLSEALAGKPVEKFNVAYIPPENRAEIEARVAEIEGLITYSSFAGNLEINNIQATKGAMLEYLCGQLGVDSSQVLAVGDANNDVQMLRFAGHSFAMANGSDEVKAVARFVTASNGEDGVAEAINKYLQNPVRKHK